MEEKMLLGVFHDAEEAECAVADLDYQGFDPSKISLIVKDTEKTGGGFYANNVAEGALQGVKTGGLIGIVAGLLTGIGAISIPGLGSLLIGEPIASLFGLTGVAATTISGAATGIIAGGLIGSIVGLATPKEDHENYDSEMEEGGVLLVVPVTDDTEVIAKHVMTNDGAVQISLAPFTENF